MFNFFFKSLLFKKIRLKSIGDYLTYIDRNPNVNFQMNIKRNGIIDIQIFDNKMKNEDPRLDNKNDYVLLLAFTEYLRDRKNSLDRFNNSHLFNDACFLNENKLKDRWVVRIEKRTDQLFSTLKHIIEEIYIYDKEEFSVGFYKIDEKNNFEIVNFDYVKWSEILNPS